jgi:hypothetical protein
MRCAPSPLRVLQSVDSEASLRQRLGNVRRGESSLSLPSDPSCVESARRFTVQWRPGHLWSPGKTPHTRVESCAARHPPQNLNQPPPPTTTTSSAVSLSTHHNINHHHLLHRSAHTRSRPRGAQSPLSGTSKIEIRKSDGHCSARCCAENSLHTSRTRPTP